MAYSITGDFQKPTLSELLELLRKVRGHETGWPPWLVFAREEIAPYAYNGVIECWLVESRFVDAVHSDFWRASRGGMMFLLRGYDEDSSPNQVQPGTILDLTLPIWRIGECLLHAERLATAIAGQSASLTFRVIWSGLLGRTLTAWANPRRTLFPGRRSRQDSVTSEIDTSVSRVSANLPEIVRSLTIPLYEIFDFFTPSPKMIQEELSEMRKMRV